MPSSPPTLFYPHHPQALSFSRAIIRTRRTTIPLATILLPLLLAQAAAQTAAQAPCPTIPITADDGPATNPALYKILTDNADVRVIAVTLLPHETDLPHTDPRPGVSFVDRGPFTPRTVTHFEREDQEILLNDSDAPMQAIRVELKHPGCSLTPLTTPVTPDSSDAVRVAPNSHKILFEDQDFRVLDVTLPPHAKEPLHTHAWPSIMIPLQMVPMRYYTPTELNPPTSHNPPVTTFKAHELPPEGPHAVSNESDTPGELIRFELKHAALPHPPPAAPQAQATTPGPAVGPAVRPASVLTPEAPPATRTTPTPAPAASVTPVSESKPAHRHHRRRHKRHHRKSTTTPLKPSSQE